MQHAPAESGARLAEIAPVLMQQCRYAEAYAALDAPVQHPVPVSDTVPFCALVPFLRRVAQLCKSGGNARFHPCRWGNRTPAEQICLVLQREWHVGLVVVRRMFPTALLRWFSRGC